MALSLAPVRVLMGLLPLQNKYIPGFSNCASTSDVFASHEYVDIEIHCLREGDFQTLNILLYFAPSDIHRKEITNNEHVCRGPAPVGSRDSLKMTASAI